MMGNSNITGSLDFTRSSVYYQPEADKGMGVIADLQAEALSGKENKTSWGTEESARASSVNEAVNNHARHKPLVWSSSLTERAMKKMGLEECQTCENRKYQDGSDDPGVSFKTAAHISPENAAATVRAHEQEHVVRNQAKAEKEDKEVLFQTVRLVTSVCPECGRVYVSGGETKTVTKSKANQEFKPGSKVDLKI